MKSCSTGIVKYMYYHQFDQDLPNQFDQDVLNSSNLDHMYVFIDSIVSHEARNDSIVILSFIHY